MKWTEEKDRKLLEFRKQGLTVKEMIPVMSSEYGEKFTYWQIQKRLPILERSHDRVKEDFKYKESIEIAADGTHKSDKLLRMSEAQQKDVNYLLEAHGYDIEAWELVSARNNIWNVSDKINGVQTLYSSKISVKPKETSLDFNRLIEAIQKSKSVRPIKFKGYIPEEKTYLHLPLYDLHFGISTLEYYENTLRDIIQLLEKSYTEVLILIGQDMLHNDNFRGQTANGTPIDKVDMVKAWNDADIFYTTIIEKAIEKSPKVTVIYSKGNHDESISWAFVKGFEKAYGDQVTFDTRLKERKVHMLGTNFIGLTHGDKNRKNVASNFSVEFPEYWAKATTKEVHVGHLHRKRVSRQPTEIVIDEKGVIVREMGSGCDTDLYHDDNGYTLAHKEFEIYEYSEHKKKRIHYV